MPNAETNIFAISVDRRGMGVNQNHEILIWDDSSSKVITKLACDSEVINCYFARKWFIVAEQSKIVAYDQRHGFQKIMLFGFVSYSFCTLKFVEENFVFAFVNKNHPEVNLLLLSHDFSDCAFTPFAKQTVGLISYSADATFLICTTADHKSLKVFSDDDLKSSLYTVALSGRTILAIYLVCEHIVLLYYSDNEFELQDFKKTVKSYFFFTSYFSISYKPKELLCLYELNNLTKPIVSYVIDYYDKTTKSIKAVTMVP